MASVAPSPAHLNAKLTAENLSLKERVRSLETENRKLHQKVGELNDVIIDLRTTQTELKSSLEHLLAGRHRVPTIDPNQSLLFEAPVVETRATSDEQLACDASTAIELSAEDAQVPDGESPDDQAPKAARKKKDRSRRIVDESNLRREVKRSELPLDQRRCLTTGIELVEVGTKVSKELDFRRGELIVVEHHQVIYGPPPEVAQERKVEPMIAPPPVMAVEGVTASPALLAWLLYQKYALHLPLYRQEDAFAQLGVRLSRKTLCDWVMKSAFVLAAVAAEIERQVRAGPVLQLDDTPVKCRLEQEHSARTKVSQSYLWVVINPVVSGVVFRFSEGRSTEDLAAILRKKDRPLSVEIIVSDGLATNRSGARAAGLDVRHAGCWAHLLRKLRDARPEAPAAMDLFLQDIRKIYKIEERGREMGSSGDDLLALRRKEAAVHACNLLRLTTSWQKKYSLTGKVAEAMKYARNQRRALLLAFRDGRVPIDNNACERAIRPVAIGRRNWMFAGSVEGGRAAATIYTLVESAKASGVDPCAYLEAVLRAVATMPASRIGELTPWAMAGNLPAYRDRRDAA